VNTPLEVHPWDQFFDGLGLTAVRRKDLGTERFTCFLAAAVVDTRPGDLDGPDAGDDRPGRRVAVADHLAMALLIVQMGMCVDPLLHLGLDRLPAETPGYGRLAGPAAAVPAR
jgi:hypothetical protein